MVKSELRTGMIVENSGGWLGIVFKGMFKDPERGYIAWIRNGQGCAIEMFRNLQDVKEDLTYVGYGGDKKIVKVYSSGYKSRGGCMIPLFLTNLSESLQTRRLLWEREPVKEVTMAEVEEKFGCKVKIKREE